MRQVLVLSIQASRLSHNGRGWHTPLDFCAIIGCLVGDQNGGIEKAVLVGGYRTGGSNRLLGAQAGYLAFP